MPDGAAYQYVTATQDLALPTERNLLISDTDGELIATARLQPPRPALTPRPTAPRARRSASPYGLGSATNRRDSHHRETMCWRQPAPPTVNDPLAVVR